MEQVYYALAIASYALFIVRFILSLVGGIDMDTDIDTNVNIHTDSSGLTLSDIVTFKGATHFIMGSSGWLALKSYTTHNVQWYDFLIALMLGIIFVIILYFIYKFLTKLEYNPKILSGTNLVGSYATVYLKTGTVGNYYEYSITANNGSGTVELAAKSKQLYSIGTSVVINSYEDGYYLI